MVKPTKLDQYEIVIVPQMPDWGGQEIKDWEKIINRNGYINGI